MRVCTQPGCTGRIVDGYCDVCGVQRVQPRLFTHDQRLRRYRRHLPSRLVYRRPVGARALQRDQSDGLMSACTQPGCTGRIVDGYCDVCGSPADAVPFVPATASAASPGFADEPGLAAVPASTTSPAPVSEKIPTQRISRVKMPTQQSSTQEMADPGAADPGVVDAQNVDPAADETENGGGEKELAEDEPDGAQGYRTRVEQAQLPDDVREAALSEVGKLEQTSDQSAESGDIRAWLDTILDLPWRTKIVDSIDIQDHAKRRRHCGG